MTTFDQPAVTLGPYPTAALTLRAAGWTDVLPLPPRRKAPPPTGHTGRDGAEVTDIDIKRWSGERPNANIAIRLPDTIAAIDVDCYDGKGGQATWDELCAIHGKPPPTWGATSRVDGSIKFLYRIPAGLELPGVLGPGVEVCQHHHRYVCCPPSIHPDTDTVVRWVTPNGELSDLPPRPEDCTPLPEAWHTVIPIGQPEPATWPVLEPPRLNGYHHEPDTISPADWVRANVTWDELLNGDGWQAHAWRGDQRYWTRPDKAISAGHSAVEHADGPLVVFSTDPRLSHLWAVGQATRGGEGRSLSRFHYLAATRHHGSLSEAGRWVRDNWQPSRVANTAARDDVLYSTAQPIPAAVTILAPEPETPRRGLNGRVDWATLRTQANQAEWICEPLIPAGRATLIVAAAKAGKSELAFGIALAVALGTPIFGIRPTPVPVMYVDAEMGPADLIERLDNYGVNETDLDGRLWCYQGRQTAFDTPAAAGLVVEEAADRGARLVIFDTFRRLAEGDENDATTIAKWHHTAIAPLIQQGIASCTLHHTGKDPTRGGRGSSEFTGWPDLVWDLKRVDLGAQLTATHKRVSWVEDEITLRRTEDPIRYERTGVTWSAGTTELAGKLAALGADQTTTCRAAMSLLRDTGAGQRTRAVTEALRYMRTQQSTRITDQDFW